VLFSYFKPMQIFDKLPGLSGNLGIQGSKITMQLPKIAGFTRDSRAYELTAENAVQDIAAPDMIELQNLRARMEMQDKDRRESHRQGRHLTTPRVTRSCCATRSS